MTLFYLTLAVLTWLAAPLWLERRRLPGLLVYGLFAAVLAAVQDTLVVWYPLWEYLDTGPVREHLQISLLISLSAAPAFGIRFAQGLVPAAPVPWGRVCKYTVVAMTPELAGLALGRIVYHGWWNVAWSTVAYVPIWISFWALHRWLHTARPALGHDEAPRA